MQSGGGGGGGGGLNLVLKGHLSAPGSTGSKIKRGLVPVVLYQKVPLVYQKGRGVSKRPPCCAWHTHWDNPKIQYFLFADFLFKRKHN